MRIDSLDFSLFTVLECYVQKIRLNFLAFQRRVEASHQNMNELVTHIADGSSEFDVRAYFDWRKELYLVDLRNHREATLKELSRTEPA